MPISIVIPTYNGNQDSHLSEIISLVDRRPQFEIICVDTVGDSQTGDLLKQANGRLIVEKTNSRAVRLNRGIESATGEMILLHHPRSLLDPEAFIQLESMTHQKVWGAFTHQFDKKHYLLDFTSWYSNEVRGKIQGIFYLDHCLFFHRSLFREFGPFPKAPIFEDTLISKSLGKHSHPLLLPQVSTTSAIRFEQNGIWRQALLNQMMKIAFYLGLDYKAMNRLYEKGLSLNSRYESD